jgi:hypothetical protein
MLTLVSLSIDQQQQQEKIDRLIDIIAIINNNKETNMIATVVKPHQSP